MIVGFTVVLMLAAVLSVVRCWRGPDWTDRILTFDLLNTILIAAAVLYGISKNELETVTFVLALAPLSFISSVFFIFYMERRKGNLE